MGHSFAPFYQAWVRSLMVIILMVFALLLTKSFKKIDRQDWPSMGLFIVFCISTQVPIYYAYNHAPVGSVQLICYSAFVITAYSVGKFYIGEKITKIKMLSMVLAFAGLTTVFGITVLAFAPLGLALAAFNGVANGGEGSSSKKLTEKYAPGLIIFWGWVFIFLTHLPLSFLLHEPRPLPQPNAAWGYLCIYAVVNSAAFWLSIEGFKRVDASIASLIGLFETIVAVVLAAIIFGEQITWSIGLGGAIIILAAMLPDLRSIMKNRKEQSAVESLGEV
jgi:drug/metabolite transporter (DMT)-like permease